MRSQNEREVKNGPGMPVETYHQRIKEEKRMAAVEAAMALFLEQGYDRTSLQQVAQRAELSTGTLFKRFPTKASLFEAIVEQFWKVEIVSESPLTTGNPRASLRKIGSDYAQRNRRPDMVSIYRLIIAEAPRFPDLCQMFFDKTRGPYLARLETYLASEVKAGTLDIPDIPRASREFLALIGGQAFWPELVMPGSGGTNEEAAEVVKRAVEMMLSRYGTRSPHTRIDGGDATSSGKMRGRRVNRRVIKPCE
jgi:TetR/AcrR family transcriptional regulator, regulator of autoinduction and epiphytic fitness